MRAEQSDPAHQIIIDRLQVPLAPEVEGRLRKELAQRQDVAFAHLTQVLVTGQQSEPSPTLFVICRTGLKSLRTLPKPAKIELDNRQFTAAP